MRRTMLLSLVLALAHAGAAGSAAAQEAPGSLGALTGVVRDAGTLQPLAGSLVSIEGTTLSALADSAGRYRLARVPPGPQVLRVEYLGYAVARVHIVVPAGGIMVRDVGMSATALQLEELTVTADPAGRARGELGTASVIGEEAIKAQVASSLAGVLELTPGVTLSPPGLDGVQQIPLRATGVSGGGGSGDIASFGTLIIMDGVPLSNNANLQSLGPRGEIAFSSSAGGGIDLRRVPASTLERVEVIRGVPSARYGDLTQGAIIVDTRAGVVSPLLSGRYDVSTEASSFVGGWELGARQVGTLTLDFAHTRLAPGTRPDDALRVAGQLAHRLTLGAEDPTSGRQLLLDSRVEFFQLSEDNPEQPELNPGRARSSREVGLRLLERARLSLPGGTRVEATASVSRTGQEARIQELRSRPAMPFTERVDEGRAYGRFIGGTYLARVDLDGAPWLAYGRFQAGHSREWLGANHVLRGGLELRREWNDGAGYQFDIEFPPQSSFNGVQGFDRPRRFDAVPPVASAALYADDRVVATLPGGVSLDAQLGVRLDVLHEGTHWFSGARDALVQPRANLQLAPRPWLRLRGGWGRTAKLPSLAQLYPAPQYFDVVNVNWYANDPAERLAVLTTFIRDPTNPDLGLARGEKLEAGVEVAFGSRSLVSLVAFQDRVDGAFGIRQVPASFLREYYELTDSTTGTGRPPDIIEPAARADSVPVLLDRPENNLFLESRGLELTALLPEIRPLRTRIEVQAAWIESRLERSDVVFANFSSFQIDGTQPRAPYWRGLTRTGQNGLITTRIVHHQPEIGLVIIGTLQNMVGDKRVDEGAADTLAFEGYITRDARLVPVPPERRGDPEFADIRRARSGIFGEGIRRPDDWILSIQAVKALPLEGELSFYAFNALDREGKFPEGGFIGRLHPSIRFGLELRMPTAALWGLL